MMVDQQRAVKRMNHRSTKYIPISHTTIGNGRRMPIDTVTDKVWNYPRSHQEESEESFIDAKDPDMEVDMITTEDIFIYGNG